MSKRCIYTARHETCYEKWVDFTPLSPDELVQLKVDEGAQEKEERRKEIEQKFIDAEAPIEELAEPGGYGTFGQLWVPPEAYIEGNTFHVDTRYTEASREMDRQLGRAHMLMERDRALAETRMIASPYQIINLNNRPMGRAFRARSEESHNALYNKIYGTHPRPQSRPYQSRRFFREEDS